MKHVLMTLAAAAVSMSAHAETLYTNLESTAVHDKASATSKVTATLPTGSMIETVKAVGNYTAVSYILDGKVQTGYILTSQLQAGGGGDIGGGAQTAQAAPEAGSVNGMVNGLAEGQDAGGMVNDMAQEQVSNVKQANAIGDDASSTVSLQLDKYQIPSADLQKFAAGGNLKSRTAKKGKK